MKKIVTLLCGLCLLLAGCAPADDGYAAYREQISEVRNVFFSGESEHFEVEVYSGTREEPYRADGFAEAREKFFLIMVYPKVDMERKDITVSFEADRLYQAKLFRNPAFDSYAYDFGEVAKFPEHFNLELSCENLIEEVTLLHASKAFEEEWEEILKKGVDLFHTKEDWQQRELEGFEIGVRLVRDRERNGELCWHFLMVFRDGTVWGKIFEAGAPAEGSGGASETGTEL